MKKMSFTSSFSRKNYWTHWSTLFFSLFILTFNSERMNAQCNLACNGYTQVSLDQACQAVITASLVLNDTATLCPGANYVVKVLKYKKVIPTSPVVTGDYVGQILQVEVTDTKSGNKCWGDIKIEDKLAPIIECGRDTIPCFAASTFIPFAYDGCGLDTIIMINESIQPLNCDPDYVKQIVRTFIARDIHNNTSAPCNDTILLRRFNFNNLLCPKNWVYDPLNPERNCPISCKDIAYNRIPLDDKGHPSPEYTGVPRYWDFISTSPEVRDTIDIFPVKDIYCNIGVTYDDIDLGTINCVRKYMRAWTIREWHCGTEIVRSCTQLIEIIDREAPYIHCPYDFSVTTDGGYRCEATVNLPPATVFDSCGSKIRVDVVYEGGVLLNKNGGTVKLPVGINEVWYRAYDACFNVDSCKVLVTVLDKTAPVAICDRETVVSLSVDGISHVYAKTFDDGSYDDCHIDSFLVRRMLESPCDNDTREEIFRPYVEFCCDDVGKQIQVVFRAKDKSGNVNDCMVMVEVQDKLKPTCYAPKDLTIACDYHFDINNLTVFGDIQRDSSQFNKKREVRFKAWDWTKDTVITFHDGFAHDNCRLNMTSGYRDERDQCNIGTIYRWWRVSDANGFDTCWQKVTFYNYHPFDLYNDIIWPADSTYFTCLDPNSLGPDKTGRPRGINEDRCDLLGFSWKDELFRIVNGGNACYKILRTWKAIDWCQRIYNTTTHSYYNPTVEHVQVIKIHNTVDPVITANLKDTTFCTFDNCLTGFATLTATATDDCTPANELVNEFFIDYDRDGTFDVVGSGVGGTINASGDYPIGRHKIKYVFEDKCGNKVASEKLFRIKNCKAPTAYCINGVAVDLMPMDLNGDGTIDTAMITVWASDLDQGSSHPCGNRVVLSFSRDTNVKSLTFTCPPAQKAVELWVTDAEDTSIHSFCRTFVDVQDNNNACRRRNVNNGIITGLVSTNGSQGVNGVDVSLQGAALNPYKTKPDGRYVFSDMPFGASNLYTVLANKNNDPTNGVSTADIVKIQKHILGIELLDSPYKLIAADANNNKTITSGDIGELRKLILGKITNFSNHESWVFVDANYKFQYSDDEVLKESYPTSYVINPFLNDMIINFVGIKIGDVNGTVNASGAKASSTRTNGEFALITNEESFTSGDRITIPFEVIGQKTISGYQFTLKFDQSKLEFEDIQSGVCNINMQNLGLTHIHDGFITFSWNGDNPISIENNERIFTLQFKALSTGQLSNSIHINSAITTAEAYDAALENMDVQLNFRTNNGVVKDSELVLYQNKPNPFSDQTMIGFDMPSAAKATLSIYDLNSKVIYRQEINAQKGYNSVLIKNSQLGVTGVLFYQLEADGYSATRRMLVIQ